MLGAPSVAENLAPVRKAAVNYGMGTSITLSYKATGRF